MKSAIHPTYHAAAKVKCAGCAREFTVGATVESINIELCSNCHPFYTGKQKLVDTAGRVDRFKSRMAAKAKADQAAKPADDSAKSEDAAESPDQPAAGDIPTTEERLEALREQLEQQ